MLVVKPLKDELEAVWGTLMRKFREAGIADADRCFEIETSSYAGNEAASHHRIRKRSQTNPEGFLILEVDGRVVGVVNCGCAYEVEISVEDFKELIGHDPDAPNVVIMSFVMDPAEQGKGHSHACLTSALTGPNRAICWERVCCSS